MKVILNIIFYFFFISNCFSEANTLKVEKKININAPPEQVWLVVRDFSGVEKWLKPYINSSRSILGNNGEPGNIRELVRRNGSKVEEKLLEVGIFNRYIKFKISLHNTLVVRKSFKASATNTEHDHSCASIVLFLLYAFISPPSYKYI